VSTGWPDRRKAGKFADLMLAGRWDEIRARAEPVELKVADAGNACLMDGAHRLFAITIAGKPVELFVRFCP
jgi:hypothetical protein